MWAEVSASKHMNKCQKCTSAYFLGKPSFTTDPHVQGAEEGARACGPPRWPYTRQAQPKQHRFAWITEASSRAGLPFGVRQGNRVAVGFSPVQYATQQYQPRTYSKLSRNLQHPVHAEFCLLWRTQMVSLVERSHSRTQQHSRRHMPHQARNFSLCAPTALSMDTPPFRSSHANHR